MLTLSITFVAACSPTTLNPLPNIQTFGDHQRVAYAVPMMIGVGLQGNSTSPLDQPTRLDIYNFIEHNPGIHFKGICDKLNLSVGVVQYHVAVLEHAGLITTYVDGQNRRFFESKTWTESDAALVSLMRHPTINKILTILAQNDSVFHKAIACSLGITSQALSWQMKQLKETGLINAERTGVNVKYSLNETNTTTLKLFLDLTRGSRT